MSAAEAVFIASVWDYHTCRSLSPAVRRVGHRKLLGIKSRVFNQQWSAGSTGHL